MRDYTDVDGVFTADPRIVPTARRIPVIDYESMLEMSSRGSEGAGNCAGTWNTRSDSTCRCTCAAPSPTVAAR